MCKNMVKSLETTPPLLKYVNNGERGGFPVSKKHIISKNSLFLLRKLKQNAYLCIIIMRRCPLRVFTHDNQQIILYIFSISELTACSVVGTLG